MSIKNIPQMEPKYGDLEINAINEYLKSGGWLMEFKKTKELEQMICEYTGAKHCCIVANGTVSLFIMLRALNITNPEDEVIVPNYTMIATPNSVKLAGAKIVLCDIDESGCLDPEEVKKKITSNTKAIFHVSINGRAGKLDEISEIAKNSNIHLLEDSAQSLGSFFNGKHLGTFGAMGSFSFSVPKIITMGQGGAIITNNDELDTLVRKIKDFGRIKGGSDFHDMLGWNFKVTDIQSVIGIEQMKDLPNRVERKKEIYKLYKEGLKSIKEIEIPNCDEGVSPWFFEILVKENRSELISHLKENGIGSRKFYPPINNQLFYKDGDIYPNSEKFSKEGIWIPSSNKLSDDDVKYIIEKIKIFYN